MHELLMNSPTQFSSGEYPAYRYRVSSAGVIGFPALYRMAIERGGLYRQHPGLKSFMMKRRRGFPSTPKLTARLVSRVPDFVHIIYHSTLYVTDIGG